MVCDSCGKDIPVGASKCLECGSPLKELTPPSSPKNRGILTLLALILGQFGIHRFYAGKYGTGFIMLGIRILCLIMSRSKSLHAISLPFFGVLAVWVLIDIFLVIFGKFTDKNGLLIEK